MMAHIRDRVLRTSALIYALLVLVGCGDVVPPSTPSAESRRTTSAPTTSAASRRLFRAPYPVLDGSKIPPILASLKWATVESNLEAIREESQSGLASEIDGEYVSGDGLGDQRLLAISLNTGFVFIRRGCLEISAICLGNASADADGVIHLKPSNDFHSHTVSCPSPSYHVVQSRDRRALVASNLLRSYCENYHKSLSISDIEYVRIQDRFSPRAKIPNVPQEYLRFIKMR